jgi:hypothetical protein
MPIHVGAPAAASRRIDPARDVGTGWPLSQLRSLAAGWRWAARSRRTKGIASTLCDLQAIEAEPAGDASWQRLRPILRAYTLLRPFRIAEKDCLDRSLALTCAARRGSVDARICFGIQRYPFMAHAWTEFDGKILNDELANVALYTLVARF